MFKPLVMSSVWSATSLLADNGALATRVLRVMLGLFYPAAIYLALHWFEPRTIALIVAALLLLRWRDRASLLLAGLSAVSHGILGILVALCAVAWFANNETMLRLYPAIMSLGMLTLFGLTLRHPPSMIERFARLRHPDLPPAGVLHTRQATYAWCGFFAANSAVAAWSAVTSSREVWALYNGFIAYLLMGVMFAAEWLVRRRRFPELR